MRRTLRAFVLASLAAAPLAAQRPSDVASPDAIVAALYDVISGPAGQPRDWARFRSLFAPGARLMPTGVDSTGTGRMRVWSPDEYVAQAGARLEQMGFFERELGRTSDRYGNVMHMLSAYDSRRAAADPKPFARGANSIQLFFDGTRWWIVSIFWDSERPGNPLPPRLERGRP
ncbi:MAG: hypothetical protein NW201_11510 [Gemmatimonadales bacterium]|nr:hypothetical protein [Gemmatimonadales bacterium]